MSRSNSVSAPPMRSPPQSRPTASWNHLAVELKLHILTYHVTVSRPLHDRFLQSHSQRFIQKIGLVNRELYSLTRQVWFKNNTFTVYSKQPKGVTRTDHPRRTIIFPNPALKCVHMIQRLEIKFDMGYPMVFERGHLVITNLRDQSLDDMLLSNTDWRFLLRPKLDNVSHKQDATPSRTQWQETFSKLRSLKLDITCEPYNCRCNGHGAQWFADRMEEAEIPMGVATVAVELQSTYDTNGVDDDMMWCHAQCKATIEGTLREMMLASHSTVSRDRNSGSQRSGPAGLSTDMGSLMTRDSEALERHRLLFGTSP